MEAHNNPYYEAYGVSYDNGDTTIERVPYEHTGTDSDVEHIIIDGETLQTIAYSYYGDSGLWAMIADTNNMNGLDDIEPGKKILIPYGKK